MSREHIDILMNRAIDGKATLVEREELARAMLADPTLHAEFDELKVAHSSTALLFERLALPDDFSRLVMRRVQPDHVPTDADLTAVIDSSDLPAAEGDAPQQASRPRRSQVLRRRANIATILSSVGALSAAAALLMAIGMLTGILRSSIAPQLNRDGAPVAGKPGVPAADEGHRTPSSPSSQGKSELPGASNGTPGGSDSPQPKPILPPEDRPAPPKSEEDEDDRERPSAPVDVEKPAVPRESVPGPESAPKGPVQPEPVKPGVENPRDNSKPEAPDTPTDQPKGTAVDGGNPPSGESPNSEGGTRVDKPREALVWGRLLCISSGNLKLTGEDGKLVPLEDGAELRQGARVVTNVNGLSILSLSSGGFVAVGKGTILVLTARGVLLEDGALAVEFDGGKSGATLNVAFEGGELMLSRGTVVVERKVRRKVSVTQSLGISVIRAGENPLVSLEGGCEIDVESGKAPATPRLKSVILPDWCGTARTQIALARVEGLLLAHKLSKTNDSRLIRVLERLTRLSLSAEVLHGFMKHVLEPNGLGAVALIGMLSGVEEALISNKEMTPEDAIKLANFATCEAKNLEDWEKRFETQCNLWLRRELKGELPKDAKKISEEERRKAENKVEGKDAAGAAKTEDEARKKEAVPGPQGK